MVLYIWGPEKGGGGIAKGENIVIGQDLNK